MESLQIKRGKNIDIYASKKIFLRVDSSTKIGSGHVMRCLALAKELRTLGFECFFISRVLPGNMNRYILEQGFPVFELPIWVGVDSFEKDALSQKDWMPAFDVVSDAEQSLAVMKRFDRISFLIVDHYEIDNKWEMIVKEKVSNLLAIDDLANRMHISDILIDQNLGRNGSDYEGLLPSDCLKLIGPKYALLRPEFHRLRYESLQRRAEGRVESILMSLGGVGDNNLTSKILESIKVINPINNLKITVVLGFQSPHMDSVMKLASEMPIKTIVNVGVNNMGMLMLSHDLLICAGGVTMLEACCMGLPMIINVIAENQRAGSEFLAASGGAWIVNPNIDLNHALKLIFEDTLKSEKMVQIQKSCAKVTEGKGVKLVANLLCKQMAIK